MGKRKPKIFGLKNLMEIAIRKIPFLKYVKLTLKFSGNNSEALVIEVPHDDERTDTQIFIVPLRMQYPG